MNLMTSACQIVLPWLKCPLVPSASKKNVAANEDSSVTCFAQHRWCCSSSRHPAHLWAVVVAPPQQQGFSPVHVAHWKPGYPRKALSSARVFPVMQIKIFIFSSCVCAMFLA